MCGLPNELGGYVHLLDLSVDWARRANVPKEIVLRRLIEWAVVEAFPQKTFLTFTGDDVLPVKMLAAFRAVHNPGHVITWPESASYVAPTVVGSLSLSIPPEAALDFLADVVVSVDGVRCFCGRMQIAQNEPPPACADLKELEAANFVREPEAAVVATEVRPADVKPATTIAAENRCKEWLKRLMADGQKPQRSKVAYTKEASERFQVGARAFARAWDTAIRETGSWSAPGRKPSKP